MKFWVYLKNLLIYYLSAIKYVNTFTSDYLFLEKKNNLMHFQDKMVHSLFLQRRHSDAIVLTFRNICCCGNKTIVSGSQTSTKRL